MRRPRRSAAALVLPVVLVLGAGSPAWAQLSSVTEIELLREASQLEASGDLTEAESLLRRVLEERAASVPALLALERILRIQGRLDELVPLLETAVADDDRSALLNQLRVRAYSALDRVRDLERAADEWIATVPRIEIPYREVARVWQDRGEYGRARAVLEEGRDRIGRGEALALPLGDLHAAMGDPASAVREWSRSIDGQGRGLMQVRRRVLELPDEGRGVAPILVDLLAAEGAPAGRLEAALELALDAGLEDRARELAGRLLPALGAAERRVLLEDMARRADGEGSAELALWAYGTLLEALERQRAEDGADRVALDGRIIGLRNRLAELALAVGDTARAATGYRAMEEAFEEGSPQRRAAAALRIELMAGQDPGMALDALASFRAAHGDAPELDRLAATVARAQIEAGGAAAADSLLEGVVGPRSAVLRGRLRLEAGEMGDARAEYMAAVPGLRGAEATRVLALVTLLGRVSEPAGRLLGEALRLRDDNRAGRAVDRILDGSDALEPGDLPPLLDFAAELADQAELVDDARDIRRRIASDYPRSPEAPEALLALGRDLGREGASRGEAREYLERLIIEYPRSALVPQARRELERLRAAGVA